MKMLKEKEQCMKIAENSVFKWNNATIVTMGRNNNQVYFAARLQLLQNFSQITANMLNTPQCLLYLQQFGKTSASL